MARKIKNIDLDALSEEDLLALRLCDLPVKVPGTWLEECIQELYSELETRGIVFRPECYLADEWLTPENETCIGIPFYLAHPVLIRLEKKFMLDAEGEGKKWCMKLLRHEAGHAICYAYKFQKRQKWQRLFGPSSAEYAETYKYRPYSKNYVRHLDGYYAQYHPDEDFVETFAVWLTPGMDWRIKYKGWKALEKLKYVDHLMAEIRGKEPPVKRKEKYWRIATLRMTLRNYYKRKRYSLAEDYPDFHDRFLKKVFEAGTPENTAAPRVADILKKYHPNILKTVSRSSGEHKYVISEVLKGIRQRCRALKLHTRDDDPVVTMNVTAYITALIMNYAYTGRFLGPKGKKPSYEKET